MSTTSSVSNDPDAVDAIWRHYFKSEMPNPWPEAPQPSVVTRRRSVVAPGLSSRLALAASVAVILFGCWMLAGPNPSPLIDPLEASDPMRDAIASPPADIHTPDDTVVPMDMDSLNLRSLE